MSGLNANKIIFNELTDDSKTITLERLKDFFKYQLDTLVQSEAWHQYAMLAKVSFVQSKLDLSQIELRAFHRARKFCEGENSIQSTEAALQFSTRKMLESLSEYDETQLEIYEWLNRFSDLDKAEVQSTTTEALIAGMVIEVDQEKCLLQVIDNASGRELTAKMNIVEANEQFNQSVKHLGTRIYLPVLVNFIDNTWVDSIHFIPSAIVIDPDYLIDVTTIAECFSSNDVLPMTWISRQFLPKSFSKYLLLGNIANAILDRLILGQSINPDEFFIEMFKTHPLDFSILSDEDVRNIISEGKRMIGHLFEDVALIMKNNQNAIAYIEPTFVAPTFGIQGRLDALFLDLDQMKGEIIELKSGKPYRVNAYGLNRNHYIQTLLYDLAIKDAFGSHFQVANYILYCKSISDRLKHAPAIKSVQFEALKVRNDLIAIQHHMMHTTNGGSLLFKFNHESFYKAGGFILRDAEQMQAIEKNLSEIEKDLLLEFTAFLARENYLAKVGGENNRRGFGFAGLWRMPNEQKLADFNLFLELSLLKTNEKNIVTFTIDKNQTLTNFRQGDIVIIYPASRKPSPVKGQLLKGSIIELTSETLVVRLRNPLVNESVFNSIKLWNAEHDYIESSSRHGYRALFAFSRKQANYREILMGLRAPSLPKSTVTVKDQNLTNTQCELVSKIISSEDYYLLWGPPGSGKTSVILAGIIRYLHQHSEDNILLAAYTNRAVDEICEILETILPDQYIRIGSRFAVPEEKRKTLLNARLSEFQSREEIKLFINKTRFFVGTLASISGKEDLFSMKSFDRLIVDEAAQILEPGFLGLASKVERIVLIGDHKQLPAVVATPQEITKIKNPNLNEIGYSNSSMSAFERLFRRARKAEWHHAYGELDTQGRMHSVINKFVSDHFYESKLKVITHVAPFNKRQTQSITEYYTQGNPIYLNRQLSSRMEWVDVKDDNSASFDLGKVSLAEAKCTAEVIQSILNVKTNAEIGVICPFRAQIAQINAALDEEGILSNDVKVDTVERYQGGAKDVVILSLGVQNQRVLSQLESIDSDGKDRKLNVALSRAREQVVIIGNYEIMRTSPCYRALQKYIEQL